MRNPSIFLILLLIPTITLFAAEPPALPSIWYVDPTGDDGNPGTVDLPLATIQAGIDAAASGDIIMLQDGTYSGSGNRDLDPAGMDLVITSASGDPELCVIDCGGTETDPHTAFHVHSGEEVELSGFSITGAYPDSDQRAAIFVEGLVEYEYGFDPDYPTILPSAGDGGSLKLENLRLYDNEGSGFMVQGYGASGTARDSKFLRNSQYGAIWTSNASCPDTVVGCRFEDNGSTGIIIAIYDATSQVLDCEIIGNGFDGAYFSNAIYAMVEFHGCSILDNDRWGVISRMVKLFDGCDLAGNGAGGIQLEVEGGLWLFDSVIRDNLGPGVEGPIMDGGMTMDNMVIQGNSGAAISVFGLPFWETEIQNCLIASNGSGLEIFQGHVTSETITISNCTIVDNQGTGIEIANAGSPIYLNNVLLAYNLGDPLDDYEDTGFSNWQITCTNIFGHPTGNWSGDLAPFYGVDENDDLVPLFCDRPAGNYDLQENSPLTAANHACGRVGYPGGECPAPIVPCRDFQDYDPGTGDYDPTMLRIWCTVEGTVVTPPGTYSEGGGGYLHDDSGGINFWRSSAPSMNRGDHVRMSGFLWNDSNGELYLGNFEYTPLGDQAPQPAVYEVCGLVGDMANIGSWVLVYGRAASKTADSFLLTNGGCQVEVRRNAYGGVSFASIADGDSVGVVSPCMKEPGPNMVLYPPDQLSLFDAITGAPSGIPDGAVAWGGTRLLPCVPNPFNPSTRIRYHLERAAEVELTVFDTSGRLVARLGSDTVLAPGYHEVTWRGRDLEGRRVASGVYVYRFVAGDVVQSGRMTLIK